MLAIKLKSSDIAKYLIQKRANIFKKDNENKDYLDYIMKYKCIDMYNYPLYDNTLHDNITPVMLAIKEKRNDIAIFLIENKADLKIKDNRNKDYLDYAIKYNNKMQEYYINHKNKLPKSNMEKDDEKK